MPSLLLFAGPSYGSPSELEPGFRSAVERRPVGALPDGRVVEAIVVHNRSGATVTVCTLGATLLGIGAPSRRGEVASVLVGPPSVAEILAGEGTVPGGDLWAVEVREAAHEVVVALVRGEGPARTVVTYALSDDDQVVVTAAVDDGRAPPDLTFAWSLPVAPDPGGGLRGGAAPEGVFLRDAASGRAAFARAAAGSVSARPRTDGGTDLGMRAAASPLRATVDLSIQ